ncbi:YqhA family protein [Thalassotalea sp. LPB0316]|uniref:YqhA family protein n=1 Tax=Thalassotalea sp. LPB0316 TaxID=2769490 RepID=UPI001867C187|nr:YqhA family protein [Thalassotalea sp. LPB0316]QOL25144.1 YqhA family protein [Thalassotalea sp. LPB0316]
MKNGERFTYKIEQLLEVFLLGARLALVLGVFSLIVASTVFTLLGVNGVAYLVSEVFNFTLYNIQGYTDKQTLNSFVVGVVKILDVFLISCILLIFSFGIYELFIRKVDTSKLENPSGFHISSLDELKSKLGKVIITILVVNVFGEVMIWESREPLDWLYKGIVVLIVSISVWLSSTKVNK